MKKTNTAGPARIVVAVLLIAAIAAVTAVFTFLLSDTTSAATNPANPATIAECATPAPTTAAGYQKMFDNVTTKEWAGGDQATTLALPDGRTMWLFADTLQGEKESATGGFKPGWTMIHNSLVIQDKGCLTPVLGQYGRELIENKGERYYWPQHAVIDGDTIKMFVTEIEPKQSDGPFGFAQTGVKIVNLSVPAAGEVPEVLSMQDTPAGTAKDTDVTWGASIVDGQDGYWYIYGSQRVDDPWHWGKKVYLARAPKGEGLASSTWSYWTGKTWSSNQSDAHRIVESKPDGWSSSFSVTRDTDGAYRYVTKEKDVFGTSVITGTATSPQGPFTRTVVKDYPSETDLHYNAMGHTAATISTDGRMLGSISRNGRTEHDVASDVDLYRPQFFEIPVN